MFNWFGVIITGVISVSIIILLLILLNKKNKKMLKLNTKNINIEICDEAHDIINKLQKELREKESSYAENKFSVMKTHVDVLLKNVSNEIGIEITEKGYTYFRIVLDNIFFKMEKMFRKDLNNFDFENATDDEFVNFKTERINSIPDKIKSIIPVTQMLPHKLYGTFIERFIETYYEDYAPKIENILLYCRKLSIEYKEKKEKALQ
jgi:hypothetical protein